MDMKILLASRQQGLHRLLQTMPFLDVLLEKLSIGKKAELD
jgi:hypothetical protein